LDHTFYRIFPIKEKAYKTKTFYFLINVWQPKVVHRIQSNSNSQKALQQKTQKLLFCEALDPWLDDLLLKLSMEKPWPLDQSRLLNPCCGFLVCCFCCSMNAATSWSWVTGSGSSIAALMELMADCFLSD